MSWEILPRKVSPGRKIVNAQKIDAIKSMGERPLENLI
jgi:hypothetical protein